MKKNLLLLSSIFSLLNFYVLAQKPLVETKAISTAKSITADDLNKYPFDRGKWQFNITRENLGFSKQSIKSNGIDQGNQSQFSLNLGTNYFVSKGIGIGIGIEFEAGLNKNKNVNTQTSNSWMAYANFTYGHEINNNLDFYARAGAGLGGQVDKYTYLNNSNKDKTNLFGIKAELGLPIRLESGGAVYLTPIVSYNYLKSDFDNGFETDNNFGFGLKLESYLFCRQLSCESHKKYNLSEHAYDQGHSFLGLTTKGSAMFGNLNTEYNSNYMNPTIKENYSHTGISAAYMYYIIKDLSLGADFSFGSSSNNNKMNNSKSTYTGVTLVPMLELNLPFENRALNNFSINVGYGFGSQKWENKNGNNNNTTKYSSTNFCAGIGYNCFLYKNLSFTPRFEYECLTNKDKSSNEKDKYDGPVFSFGIQKFF